MQRSNRFGRALVWAAVILVCGGFAWGQEPTWRAGLAVAKITPREPMWMAGYASRDHPADGTLDDLWVKVLALEDARGRRAVLVTSDLLGFPKQIADTICSELEAYSKLDRSQIMLTASHSHSSPALRNSLVDCYPLDDRQRKRIDDYSTALEKIVVETVAKALDDLAPATLSAGEGHTNFAVNRRNYRRQDLPPLAERTTELAGPNDHSVPVLAVRSPDGRLRAVAFGYACHNTTLADYQWCGDYAGFAQGDLQQKHPGAVAMFYMGCGADQNPLPRRTVELCRQYGQLLAGAVDEELGGPMRRIEPQLKTAFDRVDLDFQPVPTRDELEATAKRSDYRGRWARRLLERIDRGESLPRSYPYPVQVWRLGSKQLWIALGGEVVVDYSLALKKEFGPETWVTGYANDLMAYIPSQRVWEEGGYEAGAFEVYGLPATGWASGIEPRIMATARRLVEEIRR